MVATMAWGAWSLISTQVSGRAVAAGRVRCGCPLGAARPMRPEGRAPPRAPLGEQGRVRMCVGRAVQRVAVPPGGMLVFVYLSVVASVVDDAKQGGGDIQDAVKSRLLV